MQFLYADGADAHFMDTESFEQIAIPETAVQEPLRFLTPSSEIDVLFIDDEPADLQLPSAVDLEVTQTDPGLRGRLGLRRRHEAGDARDGRCDPGSAVRRAGPADPRRHSLGRIRRARLSVSRRALMRRSDQRRAAVSRSTSTTSRAVRWRRRCGRTHRCSRARWRTPQPIAPRSSTR